MHIEQELIELCIQHNRKAEYDLYKKVYSYLMSICLRYNRDKDTASESLNMGYLKILTHLKNYKPEIPFKLWIRRIMINTLIDEYRKRKKEKERLTYVDNYFDTSDYSEANEALEKFDTEKLTNLINELPNATKEVFNLYVIDGYTHKEIAEMLHISEGTSKWHLSEARQKLKLKLENNKVETIISR